MRHTPPLLVNSLERLAPWLGLANLLPPPPPETEPKHSSPVLAQFLQPEPKYPAESPDKFLRRFERSSLVRVKVLTASVDLPLLRADPDQAQCLLDLARRIAATLRTLLRAAAPRVLEAAGDAPLLISRFYGSPATSRSEIFICKGAVETHWADSFKDFLDAINGVEAARIRQCPGCSHFFFALRKDQKACSTRCNAARRVRAWRAKQGDYEYRRKLRVSGLLPARTKKRRRQ